MASSKFPATPCNTPYLSALNASENDIPTISLGCGAAKLAGFGDAHGDPASDPASDPARDPARDPGRDPNPVNIPGSKGGISSGRAGVSIGQGIGAGGIFGPPRLVRQSNTLADVLATIDLV